MSESFPATHSTVSSEADQLQPSTLTSESGDAQATIDLGAVHCPCCSTPMPALSVPTGVHQLMWGGFVCPTCDTAMDKWGEPVRLAANE